MMSPSIGPMGTRARLGFIPNRPQHEAGMRIEPPPSFAGGIGATPPAPPPPHPPPHPPPPRTAPPTPDPPPSAPAPTDCASDPTVAAQSSEEDRTQACCSCRR